MREPTWTLRQDYRRIGKWHVGLEEGQEEGAEDREASWAKREEWG